MSEKKPFLVGATELGGPDLVIIAGPCVIESQEMTLEVARFLFDLCQKQGLGFIFKASYVKANRTAAQSYRGPGLVKGLKILALVKEEVGCPVLSDVHETCEVEPASRVVDILQIPAFLCRQTSLLEAAGATGKPVNIKKGQFLAPADMAHAARKVEASGGSGVALTERGTFFGYHDLVVDMRSLIEMGMLGYPVIFDATHSVQKPGGLQGSSGGQRDLVRPLARAAVAAGVDGLFLEVHPRPSEALSDAACQLDYVLASTVIRDAVAVRSAVRGETNGL